MTRTLVRSLLTASLIAAAWATTSEACHRRRARAAAQAVCYGAPQGYAGYASPSPTGYYDASGGYAAPGAAGSYPGGGYPAGAYGSPGATGYDFGRPGYNPGGLGGPASGLGVRPGMGFGGFGPGR